MKTAIFAAGCFWSVEASFRQLPGVIEVISGYTGGHTAHPTYEQVCSHQTGHAEAVKIQYDENKISYQELLSHFFNIHTPTQLNRQGPDIGSQYRSAIFYFDAEQKQLAEKMIQELTQKKIYNQPIVTQIVAATTFYPAEEYHQRYYEKHGLHGHHCGSLKNEK